MNESSADHHLASASGQSRWPGKQDLWLMSIVALAMILFLILTGVSVVSSIRLLLVVAVQAYAGWYIWSRVRRGHASSLELMGMSLALGTAASALTGLLVRDLLNSSLGWFMPAVAAGIWALASCLRNAKHSHTRQVASGSARDRVTALAAVLLGLLSLIPNIMNYPLHLASAWSRYHPDMLFFEALSKSLSTLGSTDSIFLSGGQLHYHWLVYAWAGQTSSAAGSETFVVLTRVLPLVALVSCVLLVMAWTRELTALKWAPALAALLIISGGYLGATNGTILNFDSPSQSLASAWLLGFVISAMVYMQTAVKTGQRPSHDWGLALLLLLLAICIAGGKISSAGVLVLSLSFLVLVAIILRAPWKWRAAIVLGAALVGTGLIYVLVIAGSADPGGLKIGSLVNKASSLQGLNPLLGSRGVIAGTLVLLLAVSFRWAGVVWLGLEVSERRKISTIWGFGLALSGAVSLLLLSGGLNDTWFALGASAPLCALSAAGACIAGSRLSQFTSLTSGRMPVLLAFVGAGVVFIGTYALWSTGASGGNVWVSTLRWAGPLYAVLSAAFIGIGIGLFAVRGRRILSSAAAIVLILTIAATPARAFGIWTGGAANPGVNNTLESPQFELKGGIDLELRQVLHPEELAAAEWLISQAGDFGLIATNITNSPLVPALTGLPTYVSGIHYQAPYGSKAGLETLLERERETYSFLSDPSAESIALLCRAGVRWLWVDPEKSTIRNWEPWAKLAFSNSRVALLRITDAACLS